MNKCKSCGAEIIWIKTRTGKAMPCDARKIYFEPDPRGKAAVVTENGQVAKGTLMDEQAAFGFAGDGVRVMSGYISHFATCPNANIYRKAR